MDIQSLSVETSQTNVQEQAAVEVQAMELDAIKQQAEALEKLITTVPVPDPNLGQNIDLTA